MGYCPQCGQRVEEADSFCFECGTPLDGPGPEKTESLRSVAAAAVFAGIGLLESLVLVLFPEATLEQAAEFGLDEGLSETVLLVTGGFGLVLSLSVIGLCAYYYSEGYVEKRFFWALLVTGFLGLFVAGRLSFVALVGIGLYGLWKRRG